MINIKKYIVIPVIVFSGCTYTNLEKLHPKTAAGAAGSNCDTTITISYVNDILPIMNTSCGAQNSSCHTSSSPNGNVVLDVYIGVSYCATAPVGSTTQMLSCIKWDGHTSNMPKNAAKLSDCDIAKIQKWVYEGAPNN